MKILAIDTTAKTAAGAICDGDKTLCEKILSGECEKGILVCGTGIGMSIAANRHKGIRAALCYEEKCVELTRQHNNANVLCLGARIIDEKTAENLVDTFFSTDFLGGRHEKRVAMLDEQ